MSSTKKALIIGGSVVGGAVVVAVAVPLAIPAIVGFLGFGATGIAAGSTAAGIMASYGGAVTAGSACAIMQSIGTATSEHWLIYFVGRGCVMHCCVGSQQLF